MIQEIFVDGVLGAGFSGGALRLDFFSHSPEKGGEKTPRVRLIFTPDGFAGCCGSMEELLDKLVQAGIVRPAQVRAGQGQAAQAPTVRPGPADPPFEPGAENPNAAAHAADQPGPGGQARNAADTPTANSGEKNPAAPVGDRGVSPNF